MSYEFKYRLQFAPQPTIDGSGVVRHDIYAIVSEDGGAWSVVPGRHTTISVPAATLAGALASGTNAQKIAAYKQALVDYIGTAPEPVTGWSAEQLLALVEANAASKETSDAAGAFILLVKPTGYPVDFSL